MIARIDVCTNKESKPAELHIWIRILNAVKWFKAQPNARSFCSNIGSLQNLNELCESTDMKLMEVDAQRRAY